jgi:dienelactone hydrolase
LHPGGFAPTLRRVPLRRIILALGLATTLGQADEPAKLLVAATPRVPAVGIDLPDDARAQLREHTDALGQAIDTLARQHAATPPLLRHLPDVQVFHKAVDWALKHRIFFKPSELKTAKALLSTGRERATQLANSKTPWTRATGLIVRGYASRLDNSVQPYGLIIPESFSTDPWRKRRLDVWLHGRDNKLSELKFIHQRHISAGQFTPPDTIVLHPYGRFCNAFKFAGEVDVLEALAHAKTQYPVDNNRVSVRGFSMGGGGCWHLGAHLAGDWVAVAPGAGFAESLEYLGLARKDALPPTYEKALWGLYDATQYAGNLFNTSTVAYSGELDKQRQAADIMARYLAAEGMTLHHVIGPDTDHKYHPAAKAEIDERLNAAAANGRNPVPTEVRLVTRTLRYNRQAWVRVDGLEAHWKPARVEAILTSDQRVEVNTRNVSRLVLSMPSGLCPLRPDGNPTVVIDGDELTGARVRTDRSWEALFVNAFGRWRTVGQFEFAGLAKRPGLQGPIDDAFMDRFLMVRPTGQARSPLIGRWTAAQLGQALSDWELQFRAKPLIKDDNDLTDADIDDCNLILWGDPQSNSAIARVIGQLPIKWNETALQLGQAEAAATTHVPVLIYPNPLNPSRYVVLNSGFTFSRCGHMSNATQTPKLPDWALVDITVPYNAGDPDCIAAAGFFDERWQPKAAN